MGRSLMVCRYTVLVGLAAMSLSRGGRAQTSTAPADVPSAQQGAPPAPAIGQATPTVMSAENPPISSMDAASLEPNLRPRSLFVAGVVGSESLDTNVNEEATGNTSLHSVTRLLGGATLQRLWSRYDFGAAYVGGVGFYPGVSPVVRNIQELQAQQSVSWKTGQASLRDSFSYLPEGSFGAGAYGGASGFQLGLGGLDQGIGMVGMNFGGQYGVLGSAQYGTLGEAPRITNVTLLNVVQELSPRSAITVGGSYGVVHFTGPNQFGFINSALAGAEAGYSYAVTRRDQVGLIYGYRAFRYPAPFEGIDTHILQALYGHRVSGRMDLVLGAGPQWTIFTGNNSGSSAGTVPPTTDANRLTVSARASLTYRFSRTYADLSYHRMDTTGSGLFAGALSDIVRASLVHEVARRWHATVDVGFAHNDRLQNGSQQVAAGSFDYIFAGGGIEREFNRSFGIFASYQYNHQILNDYKCSGDTVCNGGTSRQVVTFGATWHIQPIRLD
jgi:hypothetical protein